MVRILHLLPPQADFQTLYSVANLSALLGPEFQSEQRCIGRGGDWRGLTASLQGLRHQGDWQIIHVWGGPGLMAQILCGRERKVIYSPAIGQKWSMGLHARLKASQAMVVCPSATGGQWFLSHGLTPQRPQVVRPGVHWSSLPHRNPALRSALGFGADDVVLLAAGESTRAAAHSDAVWAAAIVHVLDPRYKLLLWGRGEALEKVRRFSDQLDNPALLQVAQKQLGRAVEFQELLGAADMVLAPAVGEVATLPLCMAMAAGVPIIATATETISEVLEDHHTALLTHPHRPRAMAERIMQLREDHNLRWRITDRARAEAYDYFTMSRFLEQWRQVYRKALEQ